MAVGCGWVCGCGALLVFALAVGGGSSASGSVAICTLLLEKFELLDMRTLLLLLKLVPLLLLLNALLDALLKPMGIPSSSYSKPSAE